VAPVVALVLALVLAVGAGLVEYLHTHDPVEIAKATAAGGLAAAVVWVVTTLPGLTLRGVVTGGFFVLAGMLSWTYISHGSVVWAVLAVEGVVFAVWSWPWLRHLPALPRLGTAWLGLAYWLLGIVGALLVVHVKVGAQRVAYAGVFGLAALAVVATARRERGRDLSVGIVGAFLLAIAALLLSGSGNLFDARHVVPPGGWGTDVMVHRFWGGAYLLYHPNSLAGIAVLVALRVGPDGAFALWQRLAVVGLGGFVLYLTNSRTGVVFAAAGALLHAYLLWRGPGRGLPAYRRVWFAAATPFLVLALVLVASGGGFLLQGRYSGDDPTSGRVDTWKRVGVEWVHAGWAEKAFGDAKTSRAVVVRTADKLQLTTDNAAVGALRRGGVLGVLAFLLGLALLLWHAVRGRGSHRSPPAWFTIAVLAAVPTIATADWLLGGTGGTLWILLLSGEATLVLRPPETTRSEPAAMGRRATPQ
jgi:hypothetical protein